MDLEWLILGDFAQVVGNKLYLQGGGWDRLTVNTGFPTQWGIGIAASFIVPWNETDQTHSTSIEIVTDDGAQLAKIEGQLRVGRPADIPAGQAQRSQMAGNIGLSLDKPGTYSIVAFIEGQEVGRTVFNVVKGPFLEMRDREQGRASSGS